MLLSECVDYGAIPFKVTDQAEQWICIKFCVKLEHSFTETIQMIRKTAAMGHWWVAALLWQHSVHASHLMQSFLVKHQNAQVTQFPLQPRFGALWHLAFPKSKITFEREEISDCWWDSGDGDWENCVRSQSAYFEGDWGVIVLCTMFLISSSTNVSIFSYYMAEYFLNRPCCICTDKEGLQT